MMKTSGMAILIILLALSACSKKQGIPDSAIMARVGDRVITKDEFIERAEYTIRPPYLKQDLYITKKEILNSLIAEKLLAIDGGDSTELAKNEKFTLFVQGRKEQAMRQLYFQKNMYDKVKPKKKELDAVYNLAGRSYDIEFASVNNKDFSSYINDQVFNKKRDLADVVLEKTGADSMPSRQVKFNMQEIDKVRSALYEHPVENGQIIGPLHLEDQDLFLKVRGWRDKVAVAPQDIQNRWHDVKQHVIFKHAGEIYDKHVLKLMKGKRVDFDRDTFIALINILGPVYFPDAENKQADVKRNLWGQHEQEEQIPDSLKQRLQAIEDRPLLKCDGKTWTVRDLGREMALHPLQFRQKKYPKKKFGNQLRLAIVDLIRDKYITQEAYDQGLNQMPIIRIKEQMWRDAFLAGYKRDEILAKAGVLKDFEKDYMPILENTMNPVIDSLQAKYSSEIQINTDALEEAKLTRIDMLAIYTNQPYPVVVPGFPVLTTDVWLDYGKKLVVE